MSASAMCPSQVTKMLLDLSEVTMDDVLIVEFELGQGLHAQGVP